MVSPATRFGRGVSRNGPAPPPLQMLLPTGDVQMERGGDFTCAGALGAVWALVGAKIG